MVARFLGETRRILEEKENFFENWKVCLIQCDSFIQEKVMIHSAKEWETYREQMVIHGRGGTDFQPGIRGSGADAGEKRIQRLESTDLFYRR